MDQSVIQQIISEAKRMKADYDAATVKCGIIGLSGSGKSSLINAIAGEKIAATGSTEQTMEAQSYQHNGIEFVDLPGCGTKKWPKDSYISDLKLDAYDCFIIVTSTRLYESDLYLHEELKVKRGKPCFVARTKIDVAINDEMHDNNLSEDEVLKKVRNDIASSVAPHTQKVYLTSARHPTKWDLALLISDICDSQVGTKRDKFTANVAAWSKESLAKKREVAKKIVSWSAVASAANALNPVPGADVAVDVGVLLNMCNQIKSTYGLSDKQLTFVEQSNPNLMRSPEFMAMKQSIAKWVAQYAVAEGILALLKSMGARVAVKNIAKFLPFIGQAISAGIGYKMTTSFGEKYLEEAESYAENILNKLLSA